MNKRRLVTERTRGLLRIMRFLKKIAVRLYIILTTLVEELPSHHKLPLHLYKYPDVDKPLKRVYSEIPTVLVKDIIYNQNQLWSQRKDNRGGAEPVNLATMDSVVFKLHKGGIFKISWQGKGRLQKRANSATWKPKNWGSSDRTHEAVTL